jgi:hypothetical protein|tara:strand:- start:76 stop:489 length:414 start_codon:yes stop_codon:yes gene_type:complete
MSKHIDKGYLYNLPSGLTVHPCRLIHKDGTLMWKHALLCWQNKANIPTMESQEQHIIKTAQRLEELNSWVSQELEPWQCFIPYAWYSPYDSELTDGISVYFTHALYDNDYIYDTLLPHIQTHETLEQRDELLFFKRC